MTSYKLNKISVSIAATLASALVLTASTSAFAVQEMNLAFTPPLNSHYGEAGQAFAEEIDRLSDGEFKINLRPASALGGERDVLEGLQIGRADANLHRPYRQFRTLGLRSGFSFPLPRLRSRP